MRERVVGLPDLEASSIDGQSVELQRHGEQEIRREAEIVGGGRAEPIERLAAHHEEWHRDRDLQRGRHAMHASHPHPATAAGIVLERRKDHRTTEPHGRQPPEYEAGEEAEAKTDGHHRQIQPERLQNLRRNRIVGQPGQQRRNVEEHNRGKRPTRAREHNRFGQEELSKPQAARTDRLADRKLALTHRAANLHHPGDIQRDDEQHHAGEREPHGLNDSELRTLENAERVVRPGDPGLELVGRRIRRGQLRGDRGNRCTRLLNADARREPAVNVQPRLRAGGAKVLLGGGGGAGEKARMPFERNKEVPAGKPQVTTKLIRRNAHHDMRNAIHRERRANDVGVGAQTVLPELVVQDDDGFCSQPIVR